MTDDSVSRQAAIDIIKGIDASFAKYIEALPSAQPEPLTDEEQRIFLRAMDREAKVCKHVDNVYNNSYEDSLVRTCHEITRKVKGALLNNTERSVKDGCTIIQGCGTDQ